MSPKSRGRKKPSKSKAKKSPDARPAPAPAPASARATAPAPATASAPGPSPSQVEFGYGLLADLGALPDDAAAIEVELRACEALANVLESSGSQRYGLTYGRRLVDEAERRRDPAALTVVTILGRMLLAGPLRDEARAAARRLQGAGVDLPPAIARITPVSLVAGRGVADAFGDRALIVLDFERDGNRMALLTELSAALGDDCVTRTTVFADPDRAAAELAARMPLAGGLAALLDLGPRELAERLGRAATVVAPEELDARAPDPGYVPHAADSLSLDPEQGPADDGDDYSMLRVAETLGALVISWLADIGVEATSGGVRPTSAELEDARLDDGARARVARFLASAPGTAVRDRWARSAREWAERFETNGWFATQERQRPSETRLRLMLTQLRPWHADVPSTAELVGAAEPGPIARDARAALAGTFRMESAAYDPTAEPFGGTARAWSQWLATDAGLPRPAIDRLVETVWECCHPGLVAARVIEAIYLPDGAGLDRDERLVWVARRMLALPDAWLEADPAYPPRLWLAGDRMDAVLDECYDLTEECSTAIRELEGEEEEIIIETAIELALFDRGCQLLWTGEPSEAVDAWDRIWPTLPAGSWDMGQVRDELLTAQPLTPDVLALANDYAAVLDPSSPLENLFR